MTTLDRYSAPEPPDSSGDGEKESPVELSAESLPEHLLLSDKETWTRIADSLGAPYLYEVPDDDPDGKSFMEKLWERMSALDKKLMQEWLLGLDQLAGRYDFMRGTVAWNKEIASSLFKRSEEMRRDILAEIARVAGEPPKLPDGVNDEAFLDGLDGNGKETPGQRLAYIENLVYTPPEGQSHPLFYRGSVMRPDMYKIPEMSRELEMMRQAVKPEPKADREATLARIERARMTLEALRQMDPGRAITAYRKELERTQKGGPSMASKVGRLGLAAAFGTIATLNSVPLIAKLVKGKEISAKEAAIAGGWTLAFMKTAGLMPENVDTVDQLVNVNLRMNNDNMQKAIEAIGKEDSVAIAEELADLLKNDDIRSQFERVVYDDRANLFQTAVEAVRLDGKEKLAEMSEAEATAELAAAGTDDSSPLLRMLRDPGIEDKFKRAFISTMLNPDVRIDQGTNVEAYIAAIQTDVDALRKEI